MFLTRREGPVAVISIDRHDRRNSLNEDVCTAFREAIEAVWPKEGDEDPARCLVITGEGTAFCAGADLDGGVYSTGFYEAHEKLLLALGEIPIPVVAAVNGPAVGAGVQLAIAADIRVAAPEAVFTVPVVKVGLAVDTWTVRRLANIVGGGHARSALMLARVIDAESAQAMGLANEIGDVDRAMEIARELAAFAPLTLEHLKHVFNDDDAVGEPVESHLHRQHRAWHSADAAEARRARAEKRPPTFTGR